MLREKYFIGIFASVAALSFVIGQYLYPKFPSFVYYMLPTRGGELLGGALAAYVVSKKPRLPFLPGLLSLASTFGVMCIAFSLAFLSEDSTFPGLYAIPPTIGTALLILSGHYTDSWPKQLLIHRPLVYVGLISYSAYLWHWPLLSFAHYSGLSMGLWNGLIIFFLTIFLSILSYWLVEQPARRYKGSATKVVAYHFAIPASIMVIFSLLIFKSEGYFMHNNADQYKAVSEDVMPAYKYDYVCQRWEIETEDIDNSNCLVGNVSGVKSPKGAVLLWGDSNAAHYIGVLGAFAKEAGFIFKNLEHSSCPPILSDPVNFVPSKRVDKCRKSLQRMRKVVEDYEVIIISSAWTSYYSISEEFLSVFYETVEELRGMGKFVILLGKVPHADGYDRICKEKAISIPYVKCQEHEILLSEAIVRMNAELRNFASLMEGVEYYDIVAHLCKEGVCSAYDSNGKPRYYDSTHLSMPASWKIGEEIVLENLGVPFPFISIVK